MRKRKKRTIPELPHEIRERHERTQRLLAERIVYYDARIAARERGEDPDAATVSEADVERFLSLDESERHELTQRKLAERIAYYGARIAARERGEDPDAAVA